MENLNVLSEAAVTPKLNKEGLAQVWAAILENFAAKKDADALKKSLETLEKAGGQANIIESISVNGVELQINEKGVNIVVPTGTLASLNEVDEDHLSDALKELLNGKAGKATTLAGYGITDAYNKDQTYSRAETDSAISSAVKQAVTGVYKLKGSVAFAELPKSGMEVGFMYNITDAFTTTENFVEGAGKEYPAGTNVAYTENGWDAMAGIYDFSEFLKKDELVDISAEEIKAICVMPV